MKLTDAQVIRRAEQELIDGIIADLDWAVIEAHFRGRHHLEMGEDVAFRHGDLVVQDHQVNYQLDFEVKVRLRLLMDRDGNCLSIDSTDLSSSGPIPGGQSLDGALQQKVPPAAGEETGGPAPEEESRDRIAEAADRVNLLLSETGIDPMTAVAKGRSDGG